MKLLRAFRLIAGNLHKALFLATQRTLSTLSKAIQVVLRKIRRGIVLCWHSFVHVIVWLQETTCVSIARLVRFIHLYVAAPSAALTALYLPIPFLKYFHAPGIFTFLWSAIAMFLLAWALWIIFSEPVDENEGRDGRIKAWDKYAKGWIGKAAFFLVIVVAPAFAAHRFGSEMPQTFSSSLLLKLVGGRSIEYNQADDLQNVAVPDENQYGSAAADESEATSSLLDPLRTEDQIPNGVPEEAVDTSIETASESEPVMNGSSDDLWAELFGEAVPQSEGDSPEQKISPDGGELELIMDANLWNFVAVDALPQWRGNIETNDGERYEATLSTKLINRQNGQFEGVLTLGKIPFQVVAGKIVQDQLNFRAISNLDRNRAALCSYQLTVQSDNAIKGEFSNCSQVGLSGRFDMEYLGADE